MFFKPNLAVALMSLSFGAFLWLPIVHLFFKQPLSHYFSATSIPPKALAMAERHLALWREPNLRAGELKAMRRSNAEWDFMGRTFLVLAMAEMCVREPRLAQDYLPIVDTIIDETLRLEREHGMHFFLMPYSKDRPYEVQPARSLFIDGEIALMLAMRRMVEEKLPYKSLLIDRIRIITERMRSSPSMAVESYPDECWLFDHSIALAAIRLTDYLDGTDHSNLFQRWVTTAKEKWLHRDSGMLVSSYTTEGEPLDGPEGSTIWAAAHWLRLIDEDLALQQYQQARKFLSRELCGFAWSREWPVSWRSPADIDSGAIVPLLDVSAGGSGIAFIGAASFKDSAFLQRLHSTLNFAAFPERTDASLKYCASNQVGDSVMLYSMVLGPIWQKVLEQKR